MRKDPQMGKYVCRRRTASSALPFLILLFATSGLSPLVYGWTPASANPISRGADNSDRQSVARQAGARMKYRIAANDVLDVYVVDVPQFSRNYRVASDGTITVPMLADPVMAQGLTLDQLSGVISQRLRSAGLVSHPHVIVSVKSSQAHAVVVTGAVRNPQVYPIFAPTTLLNVLSQAGGLAPDAGSIAVVTRGGRVARAEEAEGPDAVPAEQSIRVNLQKLLATGSPALNVTVDPGDTVTVQRAGIVYVVGAVARPGGFPLSSGHDRMTVLQAVALGEGLKPTALQKKAMIIRRGRRFPSGDAKIPVNLRKILSGHAPDPSLEANDILFIPDSASKRALRRGAEAAIQIATGVVIWGRY